MAASLKEKIRTLRTELGLTLDRLAERTGISKSYLWELENRDKGKPSAEKLMKIADALNVTYDFLLDDSMVEPDQNTEKVAFFRKYEKLDERDRKKINEILDLWTKDDGKS